MNKHLLWILVLIFFSDSVFGAFIFNPPYTQISIRDSITQRIYPAELVAYAQIGSTFTETDGGFDLYTEGTLSATDTQTGLPFTVSDLTGDPTNTAQTTSVTEFVANSFDVLTPSGWQSGTGYAIGVKINRPPQENGLSNPTNGVTTYTNYFDLFNGPLGGVRNGLGRFYGPSRIIMMPTPIVTPANAILNLPYVRADQDGDLFAFTTAWPGIVNGFYPIPTNGFCPLLLSGYPSMLIASPSTNECASVGQYVYYQSLNNAAANEASIVPLPTDINGYNYVQMTGIYEDGPSVSGTTIALHTNRQTPSTRWLDVLVYDTSTNTQFYIPEQPINNNLNQIWPQNSNGFISFLEAQPIPFTLQSGNLFLYTVSSGTRTRIAQNAASSRVYYSPQTNGILAWEDLTTLTIKYVLFNGAGQLRGTITSLPLPPGTTYLMQNNYAVVGQKIIYTVLGATGMEIWEYDIRTGSNTLLFTPPLFAAYLQHTLKASATHVSVVAASYTTGPFRPLLINIDAAACPNRPCEVYDLGDATRTVPFGAYALTNAKMVTVPKSNPSPYSGVISTDKAWLTTINTI